MAKTPFERLMDRVGIAPEHAGLFQTALTHKSFQCEQNSAQSNEILEFLGDSVLGMVIAEYLYIAYPDMDEGGLSKAKAIAVSRPTLAAASRKIGIPSALLLGTGEDMSGGRNRDSILADAFESLVAAIYLTQGYDSAKAFILRALEPVLSNIKGTEYQRNYKSILQEITQEIYKSTPQYIVTSERGSDHDKTFTVETTIDDRPIGRGVGKSKKQAEQEAAKDALNSAELLPFYERKMKDG